MEILSITNYSEKSVVVTGNTKEYKDQLKALGGKYNGNLKIGPGYIFSKNNTEKVKEIKEFIDSVNNGTFKVATMEDNMNKLNTNNTNAPPIRSAYTRKNDILAPEIKSPSKSFKSNPVMVNYPNQFTAGDDLVYQIIIQTCPLPVMGQKVTLKFGGKDYPYNVTKVKTLAPFDDIHITHEKLLPDDPIMTSHAVIINGKWQIFCMQDAHELVFH